VQLPKKLDLWILFSLFILLVVITAASVHPAARQWLRDHLIQDTRTVVGKVDGDLTGQGDFVSVVKVKTKNDLIVEVYTREPKKNETSLRARLVLPERRDGYFQLQGHPTNLALVDVNKDGVLEIAVPTFDDNLIPRLHIYRYDPAAQVFILTGPDFLPLEPASTPAGD
jgi:hypothetical protein